VSGNAALELLVVGSGAAYPDRPGTASSTYLVRHGDAVLCLDLGQGGFAGVAGRCRPEDLAAVVISHLHPDHFVDLVALRHYLRYEFEPARHVRVISPTGLAARLDGLLAQPGFAAATLDLEDRREGQQQVGPFLVASQLVTHADSSFATRVTLASEPDGPGLVYSGDCGRASDLAPLIRPGDTLLVEAAWGPGPVPAPDVHLDGPSVGELAAACRPGRVILTHIQPARDPEATRQAVRARYAGEVLIAADGDCTALSPTGPIRPARVVPNSHDSGSNPVKSVP
jgi:ribonuclease BN (tRNA processing enzyme)